MPQLLFQINKPSHTVLRTKARVVNVQHYSHHLTGKSEQNITASGTMHSGKECHSVLWLNAIDSGKSDEFKNVYSLLYIFFLNPDYVAACLLCSLCSKNWNLLQHIPSLVGEEERGHWNETISLAVGTFAHSF